ncbi:thiamine biosynthesis protein ThiF [compost metagenome]
MEKQRIHLLPNWLANPTNAINVHLVGAGGTGSTLLTALARINYALLETGHCGLQVTLFDHDEVCEANLGRQLFADSELGMNKAVALINRVNLFFGTNWKAQGRRYEQHSGNPATITLACVDSVAARSNICDRLENFCADIHHRDRPIYLLDFGNGRFSGQVLLSTIGEIAQPESEKFETVSKMGNVFDTFPDIERQADNGLPSCSLAQALQQQDLFINSTLSNMGASMLWSMLRNGYVRQRGMFVNLEDYRTMPIGL